MMRCNWQTVLVKSHVEGAICYSTGRTVCMKAIYIIVYCFNLVYSLALCLCACRCV